MIVQFVTRKGELLTFTAKSANITFNPGTSIEFYKNIILLKERRRDYKIPYELHDLKHDEKGKEA